MGLIKRCSLCRTLLFFQGTLYNTQVYCNTCVEIQKQKESEARIKREEQKQLQLHKKQEKRKRRETLANERLKTELEQDQKKTAEKIRKNNTKAIPKSAPSDQKREPATPGKKNKSSTDQYFKKEEIRDNDRLLYISADLKRVLVIDWLKGKKKIVLNKEREVRRTHAGGFSAEKFQKFVEFKKKTADEWIISVLERPGIIRKPYDLVKVESTDQKLKSDIELFIEQL